MRSQARAEFGTRPKEGGGTDQIAAPPQVIVVQHWTEELKRLVPAK